MPTDWSGVSMNVLGAPVGHVMLTPNVEFSEPVFVLAAAITSVQPVPCGTAVTHGAFRLVARENIREVFRRKAEANTVEDKLPPPPPVIFPEPKPDRVRKKA